ncbi:isopenicillin N synthase family dioxygenase [Amnibacterium endophyticum]|uniref:Isopenicillin N synthase family dioxygenase n=1 Tax=Amnibacterium endophyticum TaxID=2109337 RepID=A0ABW4LCR6_9MICO
MFQIPVVDLAPYVRGGTPAQRAETAAALDAACRTVGFLQVVGHGVPDAAADGLAAALDDLFGLPLPTKRRWMRPAGENRGYTPPKSESLALSLGVQSETRMKDFFEAFNVGTAASELPGEALMAEHYAENTWPEVERFQERIDVWRGEAGRVARTLCRVFEDALGLDAGFFARLARHPMEVLRTNHYALPEGTRVELDEDMIGMGEHTDFGIVTVLWADRVKGLQLLHEGRWHDVQPAEGALLVNLGDLTTRLTNERWLSTVHRVKPPIVDGTIQRRRSAAYFFDGDPEAVYGPLERFVDAEHPALYAPVTGDEHVRAKLAGSRAGVLNPAAEREGRRVIAAA